MHLISVCLRCVGLLHPVTWSKSKPVSPDGGNDPGKKAGRPRHGRDRLTF